MWWERMLEAIRSSDRPVLIVGEERWGARLLLQCFPGDSLASVFVDLGSLAGMSAVEAGNALVTVVSEALRGRALPYGLPVDQALSHVADLLRETPHDVQISVEGVAARPDIFGSLIGALGGTPGVKIIGWTVAIHDLGIDLDAVNRVDAVCLALTYQEARQLVPDVFDDCYVDAAYRKSEGAIYAFLSHFDSSVRSGLEFQAPTENGTAPHLEVRQIFDSGRWSELEKLLEFVGPEVVRQYIDYLGDRAIQCGRLAAFWKKLHSLDVELQSDPTVLYWKLAIAIPLRRLRDVIPDVRRCLAVEEAPDLRALHAVSSPGGDTLAEVERALAARRSVVTLRAYGFVLSSCGRALVAKDVLREAIVLAEKEERPVQVAFSLCCLHSCELRLGRYRAYWQLARGTLKWCRTHEIQDEAIYYSALGEYAFGKMLVGQVWEARDILREIPPADNFFGVASLDGIYSTLGTVEILCGNVENGLEILRVNAANQPTDIGFGAGFDFITGLVITGRQDEAISEASIYRAKYEGAQYIPGGLAEIATAMVEVHNRPAYSESVLNSVLGARDGYIQGPHAAQAAIWCAKAMLMQNKTSEARSILCSWSHVLSELAGLGWVALGGDDEYLHKVVELFESVPETKTIRVLGRRTVLDGIDEKELPLKFAELMILLQCSPQGLSREQLTLQMYGPRGNAGTLKATLSKLRREIEVMARPYRLAAPLASDYQDVVRALEAGDVERAVDLYSGPLLPDSDAPGIATLREHLEESMRQAVLNAGDGALLVHVARLLDEDLELWEAAEEALPHGSPLLPLVRAQVQRIRKEWGVEA